MLCERVHDGPLRLLKPLYPEGDGICHAVLVHPPGGIVGGDQLRVEVEVEAGAHLVATTPGAQKWYRSLGLRANASTRLQIAAGGALEWLPQETIVFDGAQAEQCLRIETSAEGRFLGWEALSLGRAARQERFSHGLFRQRTEIIRDGAPLWRELLRAAGGDGWLDSPVGMAGRAHSATAWAIWPAHDANETDALLSTLRSALDSHPSASTPRTLWGVSAPASGLIVLKLLAETIEAAHHLLVSFREVVRPVILDRQALPLRLWST